MDKELKEFLLSLKITEKQIETMKSNFPFLSNGSFACATIYLSSSTAVKYLISSVTTPFFLSTILYGVSINPYSLIIANVESAEINPMFGPSGDSIGHNLP